MGESFVSVVSNFQPNIRVHTAYQRVALVQNCLKYHMLDLLSHVTLSAESHVTLTAESHVTLLEVLHVALTDVSLHMLHLLLM